MRQLIGRKVERSEDTQVVLVGFPSDEGVRLNGGRPGAAAGPDAIRRALYKLTPDAQCFDAFVDLLAHTADLGDLAVTGDVERDQERLGEALAPHLKHGGVPIVLGGGHETTYGHFLGYARAGRDVSLLNWDAHADVRPRKEGRPHSGSSFRLALEHPSGRCRSYCAAGLLPQSTARAHLEYINVHEGTYYWRSQITETLVDRLYAEGVEPRKTSNPDVHDPRPSCLASFDLDAVDQAAAPGGRAPAAKGLAPRRWLYAAEQAGRCPHVASMDLVELNPRFDADGRTARLAALTVWHFLRGLAERP